MNVALFSTSPFIIFKGSAEKVCPTGTSLGILSRLGLALQSECAWADLVMFNNAVHLCCVQKA